MTPAMQTLMRDIARTWDDVVAGLYDRRDTTAAATLLAADVSWTELPTGAGGTGHGPVLAHLDAVVAALPAGWARARVSRTLDVRRVADELRFSFMHDRELPWLLPGVPATHRPAQVAAVQLARVRQGRIDEVRILWDVAGLCGALGIPGPGETSCR
ncbi:ester cyclase [Pseudonocardia sp. NPDC046786]|uniref:ester cyclase n=1 Tax=Pseudonocardia sp. NPDC046786 TaxID=3155471 RepID=UPI0033FACD1E